MPVPVVINVPGAQCPCVSLERQWEHQEVASQEPHIAVLGEKQVVICYHPFI